MRRKNKFPVGIGMDTLIVVLLLFTVPPKSVQFALFKVPFCCKENPVGSVGQETITLVPDRVIVSNGALGV